MAARRPVVLCAALAFFAVRAEATVELEAQARRLGYPAVNCIYCHASPHSAEIMKEKARALHISDRNCVACHGARIPAKLNDRGQWLVAEKRRRGLKTVDVALLKAYKEPTPASAR